MRKKKHQGLLLNNRGVTLIELLVSMAVLAVLAAAAAPYAEIMVKREKELQLRAGLREIRTAIDRFHNDWEKGKISKLYSIASSDGYPLSLEILVEGAKKTGAAGGKIKYLRRIPSDPFARKAMTLSGAWGVRPYRDETAGFGGGDRDVYDVYSLSGGRAIDGTYYRDW
ncbi:MAG: type II secretion system protein [Candidatus Goldiibacteriota bacterium]